MGCNKDCLNCKRDKCLLDIEDRKEYVKDILRKKDKIRHKTYYLENKAVIDEKQKLADLKRNRKEASRRHYMKHKEEIREKNRLNYVLHREEFKKAALERYYANRDEINAKRKAKRRSVC